MKAYFFSVLSFVNISESHQAVIRTKTHKGIGRDGSFSLRSCQDRTKSETKVNP